MKTIAALVAVVIVATGCGARLTLPEEGGDRARLGAGDPDASTPEASVDGAPADVIDPADPACKLEAWGVGSSCAGGLGSAISFWGWKLPCGNPGGPGAAPDCSLCDDGEPSFDAMPWPKATSCDYSFDYADAGREALILNCHAPCP